MASRSKDSYGRLELVGEESRYEHYLESHLDRNLTSLVFVHAILTFDGCFKIYANERSSRCALPWHM
jgi:hypothetical protein